jgi:ketosteroid isomerase-like protein
MSELPSATSQHPARLASWRSIDAVARGDKRAWVDNFAEDAVVQDPIGPSPFDPIGAGIQGKAAIAKFWDDHIAGRRAMFSLQHSLAAGNEVANVGTLAIQSPDGSVFQLFGVYTYRVNDAGKVTALRTYWEAADAQPFGPHGAGAK